jgi:hypothetical protein
MKQHVSMLLPLRPLLDVRAQAQARANGRHQEGQAQHIHHVLKMVVVATDTAQTGKETLEGEGAKDVGSNGILGFAQTAEDNEYRD